MAKTFEEVKQYIINDIRERTNQLLNRLIGLWSDTYEKNICVSNAEQLPQHVKIFYDDLIAETKLFQDKVNEDIHHLYAEAYHLKILLTSDINLTPDIPLHSRKVFLTDSVSKLRTELETRQNKIKSLLEEQKMLCNELDEYPRTLNNEPVLPTKDDLIKFRQYLDDLIIERCVRYDEFTKLRHNINDLLLKLKQYYLVNPGDETILNYPNPLTQKNLSQIKHLRENVLNQYSSMRDDIDKMKIKLEAIWNCIGLEDEFYKKQFEVVDYDYGTFKKIAQELLKPEWQLKIKEKIMAARQEISYWWNKTLYSESERADFSSYTSNWFTADILSVHESELKRLKDFYYENEKLFCLFDQRQQFLNQLQKIDDRSKDPSRFRNRGGLLLQDERDNKFILSKIGNIEMEILVLADAYYKSKNKTFTANGMSVNKFLENERKSNKGLNPKKRFTIGVPTIPCKTPLVKKHMLVAKRVQTVSNVRLANGSGISNRLRVPNNLVSGIAVRRITMSPNPRQRKKTATKPIHLIEKRSTVSLRKSLERRIASGRIDKTRVQISNTPGTSVGYTTTSFH